MKKISWGVLSSAKIGREKVIPAMQKGQYIEINAIASRNPDNAKKVASELGIPNAYGSYEELLADPAIDAIYIPLPNHLHVEWTEKCLKAGKHVLCEKPISIKTEEAQTLYDLSQQYPELKVMEAFMYRFHPQWLRTKELVEDGQIGNLKSIQSAFCYFNADPENIRNKADIGGGGLLDIGCYNISLSRFLFDSEPKRVLGIVEYDPDLKTDRIASGILDFGTGTSTFTCATQLDPYQRVNVMGTKGRIEILIPFNAPNDIPCKILLHKNKTPSEEITFATTDQYTLQGDLFSQAILENREVPTPLTDAVNNMKVINAIFKSDDEGKWILL